MRLAKRILTTIAQKRSQALISLGLRRIVLGLMIGIVVTITAEKNAEAKFLNLLSEGQYLIKEDILQGLLAKELCTCVNLNQLGGASATVEQRLEICLERANLPLSQSMLEKLTNTKLTRDPRGVEISPTMVSRLLTLFQGSAAKATYEGPERGCRLL